MAQVLSMGTRSKRFCVARINSDVPQYLKQVGAAFAWDADITVALQFDTEIEADDMAAKVAGGARSAEMVAV